MITLSAEVKRNWSQLFSSLWSTVLQDSQLSKQPPSLAIRFSKALHAGTAPSLASVEPFVITVPIGFAKSLHDEVQRLRDQLPLLAFDSPPSSRHAANQTLELVESFSVSFILSYAATAKAYLLESEADCSAIQWMCQGLHPVVLHRLLETQNKPIQFLSGHNRAIAFRILLASIWLAIRRLESAREELLRNNSKTHPLPATRVFGAFGTLLMHYSRISNVRYDSDGGAQHKLSETDITSIRRFLRLVLGPVLKCVRRQLDLPADDN
jgi:hypothetical protein